MNAFKKHGIEHLSASSLNLWRESPGIWALRYLGRVKDDGNPAMWRGKSVEDGCAALLRGISLASACELAHQSFALNCQGELTEEIEVERGLISPMVKQCSYWKPPSALAATQLRIEHWFDDVPIQVIGYLDLAFDDTDVDIKTTTRCPSTPWLSHVRQVSIYRAARGRKGGILYVTGKRHEYFPIGDDAMASALGDMQSDALCLSQFLGRVENAKGALACLPLNREHFQYPKHVTKVPLADILLAG